MDIKLNYVYALALSQVFVYDQTKNLLLGIFYESLGPQKAFHFWWTGFLVENLGQCNVALFSNLYNQRIYSF